MLENSSKINFSPTRLQVFDSLRNFFLGSALPLIEVIFMYVFIKVFEAGLLEKTLLAIALKSGFLLALPISFLLFRLKRTVAEAAFLLTALSCIALLASLLLIYLPRTPLTLSFFIFLTIIIVFPIDGMHPLLAEIYSLYVKKSRAKRFASSIMAFILGGVIFSFLYNKLPQIFGSLEDDYLQKYPWVVAIGASGLLLSALFALGLPKIETSQKKKSYNLKYLFFILRQDSFFLTTLISWMFLGIANLWLLSYRTNFLVEERFGFGFNEAMVITILVITPKVMQLIFIVPLSYLYDTMNVISFRILVNVFNICYMFFFFFAGSLKMLIVGMMFFGIARAGGGIAWKLWLNNMVPPSKVASYMSIHSAFTGFRMLFSPIFGLLALYTLGPKICGALSILLVIISIIILLPLQRYSKERFKF